MNDIYKLFDISLVKGSVQRIKMSDEEYFGPEYKDYVSNSKMGLLNPVQGGSPQKFLEGFKANNCAALSLGTAVHHLVLEKDDFKLSDVTAPSGKLGLAYDEFKKLRLSGRPIESALILACKNADYYTKQLSSFRGHTLPGFIKEGIRKCVSYDSASKVRISEDSKELIYLPADLHKKCISCAESMQNNKAIQEQLTKSQSFYEDVLLCDMRVSFPINFNDPDIRCEEIIKLKMKADHWCIDNNIVTLNDVKTTGHPVQYFMGYEIEKEGFMGKINKEFVEGSWTKFCYSRQMAFYLYMLKCYVEQEYKEQFEYRANMLVVETIPDFNSKLYKLNTDYIKAGFNEFSKLLKRVAYHQRNGYEKILENEYDLTLC